MQEAHLSAKQIACRRGDRVLFSNVDFVLEPGDALQVAGPNGIGKSSLIRILAGLLRPMDGAVERCGTLGLVDERPALDPDLPLGKALKFWEGIDGCSSPDGAITAMGLGELLDIPVRYLSSGQRKRASFAGLLNRSAAIWLLDEPLNALDRDAQEKVLALIKLHCGGGGIAVIASHQELAIDRLQQLALSEFSQ